jgi:cytochrome c-type biogenesis protein CcmH/NrfG
MTPGRLDDAVAQYREALRLAPEYPAAEAALSRALSRTRP